MEHLKAVERRTGQRPKELDEAVIPEETAHVWAWFLDLHSARTSNGYAWNPISYTEMSAWGELTGNMPRVQEVSLLRRLDLLFLEAFSGQK